MPDAFRLRSSATSEEFASALSKAMGDVYRSHGANSLFITCGNCKHMEKAGAAHCNLYAMTPPVDIILSGCPSHEDDDDIPF